MKRLLLLIPLLGACAGTAQYPGPGALGYTTCEQRFDGAHPRGWVDIIAAESPDSAFIKAHEKKHMEQVRRHVTCWDWSVWYMTNAAAAEAEAFCAGARTEPDVGEGIKRAASWLAVGYPNLRLTFGEALILVSGFCATDDTSEQTDYSILGDST